MRAMLMSERSLRSSSSLAARGRPSAGLRPWYTSRKALTALLSLPRSLWMTPSKYLERRTGRTWTRSAGSTSGRGTARILLVELAAHQVEQVVLGLTREGVGRDLVHDAQQLGVVAGELAMATSLGSAYLKYGLLRALAHHLHEVVLGGVVHLRGRRGSWPGSTGASSWLGEQSRPRAGRRSPWTP